MVDSVEGEGRRGWESCRICVRRKEDFRSMIVGGGILNLVVDLLYAAIVVEVEFGWDAT